MPTSWSGSSVCTAPLSVSLIRISRTRRGYPPGPRSVRRLCLISAVAGLRLRFRLAPHPGRAVLGCRLDLAPGLGHAGADLFLGGGAGPLLATQRLLLDPLRLGLKLI